MVIRPSQRGSSHLRRRIGQVMRGGRPVIMMCRQLSDYQVGAAVGRTYDHDGAFLEF